VQPVVVEWPVVVAVEQPAAVAVEQLVAVGLPVAVAWLVAFDVCADVPRQPAGQRVVVAAPIAVVLGAEGALCREVADRLAAAPFVSLRVCFCPGRLVVPAP